MRKGGDALNAVSIPHLSTTHGVAACLTASMFSHTQAKSVASHEVVPTASMMQGRAHSGKMEMSCAEADEAAVASTRAAVLYFMVVVLRGGWCGVLCVCGTRARLRQRASVVWSGHVTSVMGRRGGEGGQGLGRWTVFYTAASALHYTTLHHSQEYPSSCHGRPNEHDRARRWGTGGDTLSSLS